MKSSRLLTASLIFLLLISLSTLIGCRRKPIDHFRFYKIEATEAYPAITDTMELRGQLDLGQDPIIFKIRGLNNFGVPVKKNQENNDQFYEKNDHLAWYEFVNPGAEKDAWKVTVINQFTDNKKIVFDLDNEPKAVLVPTWKKKGDLKEPKELSHYKLYRIINGESVQKTINLDDQFLDNDEMVRIPLYFAVPVRKKARGKWYGIKTEEHLTIYSLEEKPATDTTPFKIQNQFEKDRSYKAVTTMYLAVPTQKTDKTKTPHHD